MALNKIYHFCLALFFSLQLTTYAQKAPVRQEPELKQGSLAETALKAGIAQHLPSDIETFFNYKDIEPLIKQLATSDTAAAIDAFLPEEERLARMFESQDYKDFMNVAGEEVFFAGGEGITEFMQFYMEFTKEMNKFQMASMVDIYTGRYGAMELDENGEVDPEAMEEMQKDIEERMNKRMEFFKRKDGGIKLMKNLKIAPIYVGFKVSDAKMRQDILKVIRDAFQSPIADNPKLFKKLENAGFTGFSIDGKDAVSELENNNMQEALEPMLGMEAIDAYKAEIIKHKVVCMVGEVSDYIVIYTGASAEQMQFAASPDTSILAHPELKFVSQYATKDIKGIVYSSKKCMTDLKGANSYIGLYFGSLIELLKSTGQFDDTTEIQELLKLCMTKAKVLDDMKPDSRMGLIAYQEDGYKIDSYLGGSSASTDLSATRMLRNTAYQKDAFLSASWVGNSAHTSASIDLTETLFKTVYKATKLATEQDFHDDDWLEFVDTFRMVDTMFSGDLLSIWQSAKKGATGLSNEHAITADLNGRFPNLPEMPEKPAEFMKQMKTLRLAYANNVQDRAKLSKSWSEINASANKVAENLGRMLQQPISIPAPVKSNQDGIDIWVYNNPIASKDVNLALGVNEKLFYLSTSPSYIAELAKNHPKEVVPAAPGAEFTLHFAPLRKLAHEWVLVYEKNGEELLSESEWEAFQANKDKIKNLIDATKELAEMDSYSRMVEGEVRNTFHIKTQ